jgi:hypothetical protein
LKSTFKPKPAEPFDPGNLAMVRCGFQTLSRNLRELARDRIQRVAEAAGMHQQRTNADQAQGNEFADHLVLHRVDQGPASGSARRHSSNDPAAKVRQ